MLMPSPERIKFESLCDVVDYSTKGFMPSRDNFEKVMVKLRDPDTIPRLPDTKEVYISSDAVPDNMNEREIAAQVLERVYENRSKNRRNMLIAAGIIGAAVVGGHVFMICSRSKKEVNDLRNEQMIHHSIDCESMSINCENI